MGLMGPDRSPLNIFQARNIPLPVPKAPALSRVARLDVRPESTPVFACDVYDKYPIIMIILSLTLSSAFKSLSLNLAQDGSRQSPARTWAAGTSTIAPICCYNFHRNDSTGCMFYKLLWL